jgi:hypothetical protein
LGQLSPDPPQRTGLDLGEGELDKESNMQKMHIANSDMGQLLPDPPTAAYLPQAGGQGAKESQYDGPTDLAVFYQLL